MAMRRLGQILVDMGFITDEQLELLVDEQKQHQGQLIGRVAMDMGLINEDQLVQALAEQMSLQTISAHEVKIKKEVLAMVSEPMAQMYRVIPVEHDGDTLSVAMCDPQDLGVQDELRTFLGCQIRVLVTGEQSMNAALERYYGENTESVESLVESLEDDSELAAAAAALEAEGPIDLTSVEALADSAPVRKLLNMVLLLAIKDHASDLALRALRGRVPDPHQGRRGAVRDGAPAAAPGVRDHHPHQGDGQPGHRRAAAAPGRPHRADRRWPPGRPPRERAAHHVRRERGDAGARPVGRVARPGQRRHERRDHGRVSGM